LGGQIGVRTLRDGNTDAVCLQLIFGIDFSYYIFGYCTTYI